MVEVVTWHTFLGAPLVGALSSFLHGYFSYIYHFLIFIGVCSHLFDLAHILFCFEVVIEGSHLEVCGILGEPHMAFACSCLVSFLFLKMHLGGCICTRLFSLLSITIVEVALMERGFTFFVGVDHILSCGALHLHGSLQIHPWSWLPWDSHMWIGCMHLVGMHLVDSFLFWRRLL